MDPKFLIIDLFCGFGGTTLGFTEAMYVAPDGRLYNVAKVIACVNHDPKAIKSHWMNHPEVKHFEEDIRTLDLTALIVLVNYYRQKYPNANVILWASLECTNFSKAKGGKSRDADSRTLAIHLFRYIKSLEPDYIQIENVVEFMAWGPMKARITKTAEGYDCCKFEIKKEELPLIGEDGLFVIEQNGCAKLQTVLKPVFDGIPDSKKNGQDWLRWRETINRKFLYRDGWKELNSANYGAYTSRNRLFGIFAKDGLPIVFPEPTHAKKVSGSSMYEDLKKWKPVKEVLDFTDEGESIFNRKKDLSDKTFERIFQGLIKYVAKGHERFISKYYSGKPSGKNIPIDGPAGTIRCKDGQALVQADFLLKYNSCNKNGKHTPPSLNDPCPVISTQGRLGLVQPEFLASYYSGSNCVSSVKSPCPTIPTKDRFAIVHPKYFIDKHFGKTSQNQSVDQPAGALLPCDKHRLIECTPFLMPTNYNNQPRSITDPSPTITADRHHHYLINPSWGGNPGSVDQPCPVIIARQDKAPLYYVKVETGVFSVPIYDTDSEIIVKIKTFMAVYGLVDIKMRMLRVKELLKIQGFPENYKMVGNQTDQKKFIGNSVVPHVVKYWAEALAMCK